MLTLLAAITVSALITTKERIATKVCETKNLFKQTSGRIIQTSERSAKRTIFQL